MGGTDFTHPLEAPTAATSVPLLAHDLRVRSRYGLCAGFGTPIGNMRSGAFIKYSKSHHEKRNQRTLNAATV